MARGRPTAHVNGQECPHQAHGSQGLRVLNPDLLFDAPYRFLDSAFEGEVVLQFDIFKRLTCCEGETFIVLALKLLHAPRRQYVQWRDIMVGILCFL